MIEPLETSEGFFIADDSTAEWAIRKIKEDEAERDRLVKLANEEIIQMQNRIKDIMAEYDAKTSFLKAKLYGYMAVCETRKTDTQESYKLLSGKLVKKYASASITKPTDANMDACIAYAATNYPEFVRTTKSIDWTGFKKMFKLDGDTVINPTTGEVIDFIPVTEIEEKFEIK